VIDADDWLAAWNSGETERIVALCTPDVEVVAVTLGVDARRYEGHDGVRRWIDEVRKRFHARTRMERITPLDADAVLLEGTLLIDDQMSSESGEQQFAILTRLRDDRAYWLSTAITADAAREAWQRGVGE
jgi:hypothetical protein